MNFFVFSAIAVSVFAAGVVQCAAADFPPFDLNDPKQITAGQQAFNMNCTQYCHGKDGRIGRGPELRRRTDLVADEIYTIVTNGKRESAKIMPAWKGKLSDETIWQITAYIVSLRNAE